MKFSYLYYLFGRRWPVLLLMLAGIVVAILRRKHHPKASLLTVSALVLFIVQSLAFGSVFYLLPRLHDSGFSYGTINNFYLVVEFCRDIVYAGVIGLLVSAVLSQRNLAGQFTSHKPYGRHAYGFSGITAPEDSKIQLRITQDQASGRLPHKSAVLKSNLND